MLETHLARPAVDTQRPQLSVVAETCLAKPLPSYSRIFWFQYSCFQAARHNMFRENVYIEELYNFQPSSNISDFQERIIRFSDHESNILSEKF
jgi:hypothetical protein